MAYIKIYLAALLLAITNAGFGQTGKSELSAVIDIKTTGLNKVLCMKNGNTLLFHFEIDKPVVVKVFDSLHKEIASQRITFRYLEIAKFEETAFKGLYDINNEAVLFAEQEHLSKYVLVRVRFNSNDGSLVEEKIAGESASAVKRTRFYVMKNRAEDNYSILFATDIPQFKECKLNVTYYNNKHEQIRDVPLETDRKPYDAMEVVGADAQPVGNCITIDLKKQVVNETIHSDNVSNAIAVYDHDVCFFYIPANGSVASKKLFNVTTDVFPYYTNFSYNAFAQSLNVLLLSYREYNYKYGTDIQPGAQKSSIFFNLNESNLALNYNLVKNEKANNYYKQQTDSTKLFAGLPLKMFTNENGLSTVVYRAFDRYKDLETHERSTVFDSYLGNFCITQFDDDGNELWGTVLPGAQFFKSYKHYYFADELSHRWQDQQMFMDLPEQVFNRQFLSANTYSYNKNLYIIFNDYDKNFGSSMAKPCDTVYTYDNTNACYYKMNRKKEISKNYLFGAPAADEYKSGFIEGADFDDTRGVYAMLVQYKKKDEVTLHMAWSHLD